MVKLFLICKRFQWTVGICP